MNIRDAEDYFLAVKARENYHTIDEDFKRLKDIYLHAAYRRMFVDDYSAMADQSLIIIEHLSEKWMAWNELHHFQKRQIKMIVRWLRRERVTDLKYENTFTNHSEDASCLIYLSYHPAVRIALPALTDELWW